MAARRRHKREDVRARRNRRKFVPIDIGTAVRFNMLLDGGELVPEEGVVIEVVLGGAVMRSDRVKSPSGYSVSRCVQDRRYVVQGWLCRVAISGRKGLTVIAP